MSDNKEDTPMSILEQNLQNHLEKIKRIAKTNTVKNEKGQTVLTKDDPYREEQDWESSIKKNTDK
jgi:hypothetical protein